MRRFIDDKVIPRERILERDDEAGWHELEVLKDQAKERGL
jgi:hypothetical protein